MKRILFLLSHTEKGGGEVVFYNLVKHLDRKKFSPYVGHVDFRKGSFIHEFEKLGVIPIDFGATHLRNPFTTLRAVGRIKQLVKRQKIDVIITTGAHSQVYASLVSKITKVSTVSYVMDFYKENFWQNTSTVKLSLVLGGADYYLTDSHVCYEPLRKVIRKEKSCEVIHHGVDSDFYSNPLDPNQIRQKLNLKPEQKLVTAIARLQRWKGQDVLIRAAAKVKKKYPEVYFAIVGGTMFGMDEDYPEELENLIGELDLTENCRLMGHQDNIPSWMAASDIVAHTSKTPEPGAQVVMEAMSVGSVVVASSCGAPSEIIEDEKNGFLFEPGNEEMLAEKIMNLLETPSKAELVKQEAVSRIQSQFSVESMVRRVESVFNKVSPTSKVGSLDQKINVLFTLSLAHRSGMEASIQVMLKAMDKNRFNPIVVFLCLDDQGNLPKEIESLGVEVIVRKVDRLRNPFNVFKEVKWLTKFIKEKEIAASMGYGPNYAYNRLACLLTGCPTIDYETFFFEKPFWKNSPIFTLNYLLGATLFFAFGKGALKAHSDADFRRTPTFHIPFSTDLSVFDFKTETSEFRNKFNIPTNAFVYSIVGRIQGWKGQDVFVDAAIQYAQENKEAYFIVAGEGFWGPDKDLEKEMKKAVEEAELKNRIIFTGWQDPVPVYAISNVVCHCSKTIEPLGLVILEAFAMKKPVIASNEGGPTESVSAGEDGWLIEPNNVEVLVEAMRHSFLNRAELEKMGEAGYQKTLSIYSLEQFSRKTNLMFSTFSSLKGGHHGNIS